MLKDDSLANVLYIDLTNKQHRIERREDLFLKYIGGVGVATQLLHEECPQGVDPFAPENPIVLSVGPLTGSWNFAVNLAAPFFAV